MYTLLLKSPVHIQNVRVTLYPYKDKTRDIRSNIALSLKEFPRGKLKGTPEGKGSYSTVYPKLSPNTSIMSF